MLTVLLYYNQLHQSALADKLLLLPVVLQDKIRRKKRVESQLHSLAGYLLLQQVLQEQHLTLEQLCFSDTGKPYLIDSPLAFSISHNAGWVGLCWARHGRVGLDLQAHREFEPIESTFSFFSNKEQKAILQSKHPQHTLIHYWSKKEALIKAGGGRMFDEAAQTNTTLEHCQWRGESYYWSPISTEKLAFNGAIWTASNFLPEKIIIKKQLNL